MRKLTVNDEPYEPLPKQGEFHRCQKKYKAYVGGMGSGKTLCGVIEGIKESAVYPNNLGFIGRLTSQELKDTTIHDLLGILSENGMLLGHNKSERHIKVKSRKQGSPSTILYRPLENRVSALKKIDSLNLGWFHIDEGSEVAEDCFLRLSGRLRRKNASRTGWVTSNPEGHNWIWSRFHSEGSDFDPNTYELFNAPTDENIHLPEDYIDNLLDNFPDDWIDRYVYGTFEGFKGLVYKDFSKEEHVVAPFEIPPEWQKIVALDYGLNNPTAVLWMALDDEENVWIYDEHYKAGSLVSYHAEIIKDKTGNDDIYAYVIDPSCHNRTGKDGRNIIDAYADCGLYFIEGDNAVDAGVNRCAEFVKLRDERIHPQKDTSPAPQLFVFDTCKYFIEEITNYKWKEYRTVMDKNAPEKPQKKDDHCMDALRYGMMFLFPYEQQEEEERTDWDKDDTMRPEKLMAWLRSKQGK